MTPVYRRLSSANRVTPNFIERRAERYRKTQAAKKIRRHRAAVEGSRLVNRINRRNQHWFHKWVQEGVILESVTKPSKNKTNFSCIYQEVDKVKRNLFENREPFYEAEDFYDLMAN